MCKRDLDMQTCSRPLINEFCARSVHTFLMWDLLLGGMHAPGCSNISAMCNLGRQMCKIHGGCHLGRA